jgi:hypothetical protein
MYENHHKPKVERLSANIAMFEKRIPRRELVSTIEPLLHEYPTNVTLWLAVSWSNESNQTRRSLIERWGKVWEETVRARPADSSPAHLWIKSPNGSYMEAKVSKNR